ncbi:MAG: hypothetical protein HYV37_04000 [Candidatus Levyibacteriota bacterium]|nr:MAG: hypothetical protein HYV37_04000 [Candidatus Levybacteria bacterium]
MNDKINLLKGSKAKRFRQEKILKIIRISSVVSLTLVVLTSLIFFFLKFRLGVESLKEKENAAISQITAVSKKAGKLLYAESRIKDISDILKKRSTFDGVITETVNVIPSNITVQSLNLDKKNLSMTITSSSLLSIDKLLNGFENLSENKKIFAKITLEGLTVDPKTGKYTISLTGNLP